MTTISDHFTQVQAALALIDTQQVMSIANLIRECQARGGTVWLMGNGGSTATASHFACDLQKVAGIRAIALTDNVPLITAWANDSEFADVFWGQLRVLAHVDDLVIALSCSGASSSIMMHIGYIGKWLVMITSKLCPFMSSEQLILDGEATVLRVDSTDYGVIEDCHLSICHAITKEIANG